MLWKNNYSALRYNGLKPYIIYNYSYQWSKFIGISQYKEYHFFLKEFRIFIQLFIQSKFYVFNS